MTFKVAFGTFIFPTSTNLNFWNGRKKLWILPEITWIDSIKGKLRSGWEDIFSIKLESVGVENLTNFGGSICKNWAILSRESIKYMREWWYISICTKLISKFKIIPKIWIKMEKKWRSWSCLLLKLIVSLEIIFIWWELLSYLGESLWLMPILNRLSSWLRSFWKNFNKL